MGLDIKHQKNQTSEFQCNPNAVGQQGEPLLIIHSQDWRKMMKVVIKEDKNGNS